MSRAVVACSLNDYGFAAFRDSWFSVNGIFSVRVWSCVLHMHCEGRFFHIIHRFFSCPKAFPERFIS